MSLISLIFLLFCFDIKSLESARILGVFPTPSISHQVVFRRLTDELVRRSHEVSVITTDPAYPPEQAPANLKEINLHDLSYEIWINEMNKETIGSRDNLYDQTNMLFQSIAAVFKGQLETNEVQAIIHKEVEQFDLLLLEAWVKSALIFTHILKVPVIQVSSLGAIDFNLKTLGVPTHPLLYRSLLCQRLYNLTNWEKIQELYKHVRIEWNFDQLEEIEDKEYKKMFSSDILSIKELSINVDMLFLNVHSIWVENQPVTPSVVYIGGIHTKPPKELPKVLQNYLDSSKYGLIYFSLGTNVNPSLLPSEKKQIFFNVLSRLPYEVLLKWDTDEFSERSKNIKIFKWLPQSDILRHPKVKLFITQGGLQSTDEAITAGVPLIGIPMIGDQWYNVEKYLRHGIGLRLDLDSLTEIELEKAINTVINDNSFQENIMKLRKIMEDQPQSPMERAVSWTEHVLRHGGAKHLRGAGANITWSEYLELDLILIVLLFVTIIFLLIVLIVLRLISYLLRIYKTYSKIKIS